MAVAVCLSEVETVGIAGERVAVMQFTGLKDKNGKDIYEGDIVRHLDQKRLSIVEWDPAAFVVRHLPDLTSDFIAYKNHFEVIGNIYENPELVESR